MTQQSNLHGREPNSLINEVSPYLLQHAYNPIHWQSWNNDTFIKARNEFKPIFLSIGYSTCHWCHVMEAESFEDEEVASILNQYFIPIKLDREERPDIDAVYMEVCQALTGHGGWPLTIIMTPEKKPFFAGTYFPKFQTHRRPGLLNILSKIKELWSNNLPDVIATADSIVERIQLFHNHEQQQSSTLPDDIFDKVSQKILDHFDNEHGGMNRAPKFPSPHLYMLLLRLAKRTQSDECLKAVEHTALAMRKGGIWDHIGYGFHRYSTDMTWTVPHFEKMLYDQAMLLFLYAELFHKTKKKIYKTISYEIMTYVQRTLMSEQGLFYSAEDADSEGEEGKYYVWSADEIRNVLAASDADMLINMYSISNEGNYIDEATHQRSEYNIPYIQAKIDDVQLADLLKKTEPSRITLLQTRELRAKPFLDDKILTDWNALYIASLAYAARIFRDKSLEDSVKKSFSTLENTVTKNSTIFHRYRHNNIAITAFLDDVSCLAWASWELFLLTSQKEYLIKSESYCQILMTTFYDNRSGGFFTTSVDSEQTPFGRQKQWHDGAIPSGNSIACHILAQLGSFTHNNEYLNAAFTTILNHAENITQNPESYSFLLLVVEYLTSRRKEIIVSTPDSSNPEFLQMYEMLLSRNDAHSIIVINNGSNLPLSYTSQFNAERPCVFICENYCCLKPLFTLDDIEQYLAGQDS